MSPHGHNHRPISRSRQVFHGMEMGRFFKWAGIALAGLTVALVAFFALVFNWNMLRGVINDRASAASEQDIEIGGNLDVDLSWAPRITAEKITVGNAEWGSAPEMAEIERLVVSVDLCALLGGTVKLPQLEIENARLLLEKDKAGEKANWNFGDNPAAGAVNRTVVPKERASFPEIGRLRIVDSRLVYREPARGIDLEMDVSTARGATEQDDRVKFSGKGEFEKAPFRLSIDAGSIIALRDEDNPYPLDVDIRIGKTAAKLSGSIDRPLDMQGVDVKLRLEGANPAELFPIIGLPVPDLPPYSISGNLLRRGEAWEFRDFAGKVGDSDLKGVLKYAPGDDRPTITADLTSSLLDFEDLGGFVGAAPAETEKTELSEKTERKARRAQPPPKNGETPPETERVLPDTPFDIGRLRAADLDVKFRATRVLAPNLPIDRLTAHLTVKDGLLRFQPLNFGIAAGNVRSQIVLDGSRDVPRVQADLEILHVKLASLMKGTDFADRVAGEFAGRAKLKGRGASTREMLATADGDIAILMNEGRFSKLLLSLASLDVPKSLEGLLFEDDAMRVRCLVGDFKVERGVMRSRALVFDTEEVRVDGEGTVNLGTEQLDLTVLAHPKEASIGARTPIEVGGTFANPEVGPNEAALGARAGAAAALGALLTPLGALLPFIQLGLGEDSNCAALVHNAREKTERKGGGGR
ncbi:MAG: AsmA family protein [Alphaproteobacteria bacterium]|nr:AsmA family protein [Alphaproteobacteria bacterium]